jgi:hypothetical protein
MEHKLLIESESQKEDVEISINKIEEKEESKETNKIQPEEFENKKNDDALEEVSTTNCISELSPQDTNAVKYSIDDNQSLPQPTCQCNIIIFYNIKSESWIIRYGRPTILFTTKRQQRP